MMTNLALSKTTVPSTEAIAAVREQVADFGRLLFERHLTDANGGNLSVRVGNRVCMTPRYAGSHRHWQLRPEDVLVYDMERTLLKGQGEISREADAHFRLHEKFAESGTAIIHAHSRNIMVFASLNKPIPPVLEATRMFGVIPVAEFAPASGPEAAQCIIDVMSGQEQLIQTYAAAVIAPWHGLFLMGKDLYTAFDAVERIDTNAYCLLMGQMYAGVQEMAAAQNQMEKAIGRFSGVNSIDV